MSTEQTKKILTQDTKFSQLGFSLLVTRLRGAYKKSPDARMIQQATKEINDFLAKYQKIMAKDYTLLTGL